MSWPPGRRLSAILFLAVSVAASTASTNVLVLYDSSGASVGQLHAMMLANLLGHFQLGYRLRPIEEYKSGQLASHPAVFYFGTVFNQPLPPAFLQDALAATNPVCWFKYNLWQLSSAAAYSNQFRSRFGFRFDYMDDSALRVVRYKGEEFGKDPTEIELGHTTILKPMKARAIAMAGIPGGVDSFPYIVRASNFWYIADSPFSFISEEDRYLVFCDVLHDILNSKHPEIHRALIRLEDVDPTFPPQRLRDISELLRSLEVPFGIGVIPIYSDPTGVYNNGIPRHQSLSQSPDFIEALRYAATNGGELFLHGYTHQYLSAPNPYTTVTGDDYEFFRVVLDGQNNVSFYGPVPEDSMAWAQERVTAAMREFNSAGLIPLGWVTPHYAASSTDYQVFATNFSRTYQRVLYSDSAGGYSGQFFPYPIIRDTYGQNVIPENLGHIDPVGWRQYPKRLPADIIRAARKNLVVRDGWASTFFHPFLDSNLLREVITGVEALGYRYVAPTAALLTGFVPASTNHTTFPGQSVTLSFKTIGPRPVTFQWRHNGALLAGQTNSTLRLTNLWAKQSGAYTLEARNQFGTSIAVAIVRVAGPPCSITRATNGAKISFRALASHRYVVERSQDLRSWTTWTNFLGDNSLHTLRDNQIDQGSRYYRLRVLP